MVLKQSPTSSVSPPPVTKEAVPDTLVLVDLDRFVFRTYRSALQYLTYDHPHLLNPDEPDHLLRFQRLMLKAVGGYVVTQLDSLMQAAGTPCFSSDIANHHLESLLLAALAVLKTGTIYEDLRLEERGETVTPYINELSCGYPLPPKAQITTTSRGRTRQGALYPLWTSLRESIRTKLRTVRTDILLAVITQTRDEIRARVDHLDDPAHLYELFPSLFADPTILNLWQAFNSDTPLTDPDLLTLASALLPYSTKFASLHTSPELQTLWNNFQANTLAFQEFLTLAALVLPGSDRFFKLWKSEGQFSSLWKRFHFLLLRQIVLQDPSMCATWDSFHAYETQRKTWKALISQRRDQGTPLSQGQVKKLKPTPPNLHPLVRLVLWDRPRTWRQQVLETNDRKTLFIRLRALTRVQPLSSSESLLLSHVLLKTVQKQAIVNKVKELSCETTLRSYELAEPITQLMELPPEIVNQRLEARGLIPNWDPKRPAKGLLIPLNYLVDARPLSQSVLLTLIENAKCYLDQKKKLADLHEFFTRHQKQWAHFLLFMERHYVSVALARKWDVSQPWVFKWLTGIRRKFDPFLPQEFQIHQPVESHASQAPLFPRLTRDQFVEACDQEIAEITNYRNILLRTGRSTQTIGIYLQRLIKMRNNPAQVLSRLFPLAPSPNAPALRLGWELIQQKGVRIAESFEGSNTRSNYRKALVAVLTRALLLRHPSNVLGEVFESFLLPLDLSAPHLHIDYLLQPRHCLSRPFSQRWRNLVQNLYPPNFFSPEQFRLLFQSLSDHWSRFDHWQPINLIMGAHLVIKRPAGGGTALTSQMHHQGYIMLIFPDCSFPILHPRRPIFRTKKLSAPRELGSQVHSLPVRLPATSKMTQVLANLFNHFSDGCIQEEKIGIRHLRIIPPQGPAHKIGVDVIFEGPLRIFAAVKHLAPDRLTQFCIDLHLVPPDPQDLDSLVPDSFLGLDVNAIGSDVLAYSNRAQLSPLLLRLCDRYKKRKLSIANLQRLITVVQQILTVPTGTQTDARLNELESLLAQIQKTLETQYRRPQTKERLVKRFYNLKYHLKLLKQPKEHLRAKIRRRQHQFRLLEQRIAHLRTEVHSRCSVDVGSHLLVSQRAALVIEDLGIDPAGKGGRQAIAIYSMPDEPEIFYRVLQNLNVFSPAHPRQLYKMKPDGTSLIHVGCDRWPRRGQLERTKNAYRLAPCSEHCPNGAREHFNTHENAALRLEERALGQHLRPSP